MKTVITVLLILNLSVFSSSFSTNVHGFEENCGQLGDIEGNKVKEVIFYTKYKDFGVYITEKGVSYVIYRYEEPPQAAGMDKPMLPDEKMPKPVAMHYSRIDIDLVNSSIERSNIEYKEELPGYSNYYLGHCPEGVLYVKSYREVRIKGVYEGIDWIWRYDERGELHHEFELSTYAEPEVIKLKINYADYELTPNGKKLILSTPLGKIEDGFVIGHRSESMIFSVEVRYRDNGDGTIGYNVSNWDRSSKLIIDPPLALIWGTYYGGSATDFSRQIAADLTGNVYVTGYTVSNNFPTQNPGGGVYFQGTYGGGWYDAFILKFTNPGARIWATYYGGSLDDEGYSITTDFLANVFITGSTASPNFPTQNPGGGAYFQGTTVDGDVFILKFNNSGVRLWATYYGGSLSDYGHSVISDASGNIYITGYTNSTNFPTQDPGGGAFFQGSRAEDADAFIMRFNNSGVRHWATYYGGNGMDVGYSISKDTSGNIFITGWSLSTNFPTHNPGGGVYYQGTYGGGLTDAFIIAFNNLGARTWATYYGGNNSDYGYGIVTDISGYTFVTGETRSTDFPIFNPGGGAFFQGSYGGGFDAFVLKFTNSGIRTWATYYGGLSTESASSITTDILGNIILTGQASSGSFPVYNPGGGAYFQGSGAGGIDAFVLRFSHTGVRTWATFFGGNANDVGSSIVTDITGNIYLTGRTESTNFPLQNPGGGAYFQSGLSAGVDLFISKFESSIVNTEPISSKTPATFVLYQNHPNPFNPFTIIRFDIPISSVVKLHIYDLNGKEILKGFEKNLNAGSHEFIFDGGSLSSGIYLYKVVAGKWSDMKKMILLK